MVIIKLNEGYKLYNFPFFLIYDTIILVIYVNFTKIKEIISSASNVYIMGHYGIDLDAFGASLGLYYYITSLNKNCYIIIDELESDNSIIKTKEELFSRKINISTYTYDEIKNNINKKSLLIVVDVNRKSLVQNPKLLEQINNIIVLDHHKETKEQMENTTYKYIDETYSSTCEIVIDILKHYGITIPNFIASIMLGGIVVDTNNFTLKTSDETYLNASYLTQNGADPKEVQYLLKESLEEYFSIQKIIENVILINDKYAVCTCDNNIYNKEFLAKIASRLLSFDSIEASFAIGKIEEEKIGISSRSIGNIDVSTYMKKLGGGGHITDAACQIIGSNINEVKEKLLSIIKEG